MQTVFLIKKEGITGIITQNGLKEWKQCEYCKKHFIPTHHRQKYCDKTCYTLHRRGYKTRWQYHRRSLEYTGEYVNDKTLLNVGTGGLGEHMLPDFDEEHKKIIEELHRLKIRR